VSHANDNAFPGAGGVGLSKREWIAAQIYAAYIAQGRDGDPEKVAEWSVKEADLLIRDLSK
jgi:hypothetical protein